MARPTLTQSRIDDTLTTWKAEDEAVHVQSCVLVGLLGGTLITLAMAVCTLL
jgi:hypothetical protein